MTTIMGSRLGRVKETPGGRLRACERRPKSAASSVRGSACVEIAVEKYDPNLPLNPRTEEAARQEVPLSTATQCGWLDDLAFALAPIERVVCKKKMRAAPGCCGASACVVPLKIDGLAVRRTQDDRLIVTWPARTTDYGKRHPIVNSIDADLRRRVEAAVMAAYFAAARRAGLDSR